MLEENIIEMDMEGIDSFAWSHDRLLRNKQSMWYAPIWACHVSLFVIALVEAAK